MIELRTLQKVIGGKTALDIPELTVGKGEIAGIAGLEDSGRGALFGLLTGRLRPTLGTVRLAGADPAQSRRGFHSRIGVVFAEDALYRNLTVRANLEFAAKLYGAGRDRIGEVLAEAGLADQAATLTDKLPSSLMRRLAFGRAILHRPEVLILEELFARCDETTVQLLISLVRGEAERGAAVLLLAGSPERMAEVCGRIFTLSYGRLLETRRESSGAQRTFKLPVKLEDKVVLVNPADILYADAGEGRAVLVTLEGRLPTPYTLAELANRLSLSGFFRAHRSVLVNLQHVKEVIPYTRNAFSIRLDDPAGTNIPLSKSAAAELKAFFGY